MIKLKTLVATLFVTATVITASAQSLPIPPPSPWQTVKQQFATSSISIDYSRPSVNGRTIFGDLVPYGKVWRTGANAATTIEFGDDVTINRVLVPKGKYGLLTIPSEKDWTIIISKDVNVTSDFDYNEKNDVVRIMVKAAVLDRPQEMFTIGVENVKPTQADIQLSWSKTLVSFTVTAEIDAKIMAAIDKEMLSKNPPYHQAANYYYENNKDLAKALEWSTKAVAGNANAYWMSALKAKIEFKLKKYKDAVASAEKSIEQAKKGHNEAYVKKNEELIKEIKAQPDFK
ncbi:MAG TPA: DUF2911 domain-containing protein [Chitinophagales bacterium]|nr:MAG: hypothetical protein BGO32_09385 [Bacteroidetes bacterium 37-13]HRN94944.1 DUF2911 domain-containing protein [Chitinophagales bacterium]HRP38899.1 DUF2911 domain-containing protein [Chitinophagales bacterium]